MSVQSANNYISFVGNNSTVTPYAITSFYWFDDTDLVVTVTDLAGASTVLTLNTDYTVSGSDDPNGGSIVTTAAVPVTSTVAIERVLPLIQTAEYNENDAFPAKLTEHAFDKLVMICQQIYRSGSNALRATAAYVLQPFTPVENTVVGFGSSTSQPITYTPAELLAFLSVTSTVIAGTQPTAVFLNAAARTAATPGFLGQIGLQVDTGQLYQGASLVAGSWTVYSAATKSFADATARGLSAPDFVGQLGVQIDTNATYRASGTSAGNWTQTTASNSIADGAVTQVKLASDAKNFRTGIKGLVVKRATGSTITIDLDEVVMTDGAGVFVRFISPSTITVNMAASGINGLDTGSEASNTWYNVHLISNGTTLGAVFSVSLTSPTFPSGYTMKEYAAVIRNDGSSNIQPAYYQGKSNATGIVAALSAINYSTPTVASLASFLPPNVSRVRGVIWSAVINANLGFAIQGNATGGGQSTAVARSGAAIALATFIPRTFSAAFDIALTGQSIFLTTSNHVYNLEITGWDIK